MTVLAEARKFYARLMAANSGSADPRLEDAFATVPREAFLGPGPWTVIVGRMVTAGNGKVVTPSADPPKCESDAMIVFDASGSMTGMGFGENTVTRIQQVRRALATVLPSVAPVRNLGLVVFGPGAHSQCENIDLKLPPGPNSAGRIMGEVNMLQPYGQTPITSAVSVATDTFTAPSNTSLPLYLGSSYANGNIWNGGIDEVRLYNRALTDTDVASIFAFTGNTGDTTPPSIPGGISASAVSSSQINVSWSASTDNVAVTGYRVFRNGTLVASPSSPSFSDTGLSPSTLYSYTVAAVDAAANVSAPSTAASSTTLAASDTTPPTVSITTPTSNSTLSGTITLTASANDNVAVSDVQFQLDGVNLGADLTSPPYSISWNTTSATNGTHNLTAIARDAAHNATTSSVIPVSVNNAAGSVPTAGLIGYWNFDEGSGPLAHDTSGSNFTGTLSGGPAWTTGKINSALSFNGNTTSVATPNIPLGGTFSLSVWVNPAASTQGGYSRILETKYDTGLFLGVNDTGSQYKFIVNSATGSTAGCGKGFGCAQGGTITTGWHLVTATFDGSSAKLYVDSVLVGSDTFSAPSPTNFPLYMGRYFASNGFGWNGAMDEVRLYNRALTAAKIEVPIAKTYPMSRSGAAYKFVTKGHVLGKVALRIR